MPANKKYPKETTAAFKSRMKKKGPAKKKANEAAKKKY
jgi:hypothetical protein